MFIVCVVVSVLLSIALVGSARAKLVKDPKIVESLSSVGVPTGRLWMLAVLEIAGAVGLLIGLLWAPLGIAAAVGVVLYFVGAVGAHLRVKDPEFQPALVLLVVAVAALVLRLVSA